MTVDNRSSGLARRMTSRDHAPFAFPKFKLRALRAVKLIRGLCSYMMRETRVRGITNGHSALKILPSLAQGAKGNIDLWNKQPLTFFRMTGLKGCINE